MIGLPRIQVSSAASDTYQQQDSEKLRSFQPLLSTFYGIELLKFPHRSAKYILEKNDTEQFH